MRELALAARGSQNAGSRNLKRNSVHIWAGEDENKLLAYLADEILNVRSKGKGDATRVDLLIGGKW